MIAYIQWKILDIKPNEVLVLTENWIGYEIIINERIYSELLNKDEAELYIYHHITEVSQMLFWFLSLQDKSLFKAIIKISGIGWKIAISMLWVWTDKLINAIKQEDNRCIESIPGIGKKMAQKVILELKDKDIIIQFTPTWDSAWSSGKYKSIDKDIFDSLVGMGYNARHVEQVLSSLPDDITTTEEILPYALKELSN